MDTNLDFSKYSVSVYTLGCKVNQYESEAITEAFLAYGFKICDFEAVCDIYIINTCTVTSEGDRKAGQIIRRARKKNPLAVIIVCGCFAQVAPEKVAKIDGVDYICGTRNKMTVIEKATELLCAKNIKPEINIISSETSPYEKMNIEHSERTRAYIKIEDGCENKCTYCIIPRARGSVASRPCEDIMKEIRTLADNGYREIVLTGIETASYGRDLNNFGLFDLLSMADKVDGINRIRLGSLDPSFMRADFCDKIASLKKVVPHFHLSQQSGSDDILRLMKRKYNTQTSMAHLEYLRKIMPDVLFTTDMMVGFPSETEELFNETLEFVKKARYYHIHIFTYSKRAGTPAAEMDCQIPEHIKNERAARLAELSLSIKQDYDNNFIKEKKVFDVLFETCKNGIAQGHTPSFVELRCETDENLHGIIKKVRASYTKDNILYGEIL